MLPYSLCPFPKICGINRRFVPGSIVVHIPDDHLGGIIMYSELVLAVSVACLSDQTAGFIVTFQRIRDGSLTNHHWL